MKRGVKLILVARTEGLQKVKESVKPFDWTYTTNYRGTLSSTKDVSFEVIALCESHVSHVIVM